MRPFENINNEASGKVPKRETNEFDPSPPFTWRNIRTVHIVLTDGSTEIWSHNTLICTRFSHDTPGSKAEVTCVTIKTFDVQIRSGLCL
jgi:hypothetical protein